jgi:hypothetical protein
MQPSCALVDALALVLVIRHAPYQRMWETVLYGLGGVLSYTRQYLLSVPICDWIT